MEMIVYQQIRNEITSIIASSRQLVLGQFLTVLTLLTVLFDKRKFDQIFCIIVGIILFATLLIMSKLGSTWYMTATRQGAFLLVAYEIPKLQTKNSTPDFDIADLWILANRAESLRNRDYFLNNLRDFYFIQIFFSIISLISFFWILSPFLENSGFPLKRYWGVCILFFFESIYFIYRLNKNKDYAKVQIKNWKEYFENINEYNKNFFKAMELTPLE